MFLWVGFLLAAPLPLEAAPSGALSAGGLHTCALSSGGGVVCWGQNASSQLGDGATTNRAVPVAVRGLASPVTAVAAGFDYTCALTSAGGVVCWGRYRLADTTSEIRSTPTVVSGLSSGVTAIAAGSIHTCAVTTAGGVVCWGHNFYGQLGDGTTTNHSTPVAVSGLSSGVTAIAAGGLHVCALTTGGGVVCWGYNGHGQVGDGTTTDRSTPVPVSGLSSGVIAISAGNDHTCALTTGGGVVCWGQNTDGQVGDGTTTNRTTPVPVSGLSSGVTAVAAGGFHTCALTSGGGVRCWGSNNQGALGDGTTTNRTTPVAVSGLASGGTAIVTGYRHACALISGGGVRCWGSNDFGQLGDGTTTDRLTPVVTVIFSLISPSVLTFGAVSNGSAFTSQTAAQTVRLSPTGAGPVTWTATSSEPWLTVTPASGSQSTPLSVAVRFESSLATAGRRNATITLSLSGAGSAVVQIPVTLQVMSSTAAMVPSFGFFETPAGDATVLAGSVAVTGWALDNVGVQRVELWRDLQPGETTPPYASTPSDPRNGKVFIANPSFVDGARPDVESVYPAMPFAYRAGWGYLLLTWGLWNQGNGTYKLYAFGFDEESNVSTLGSKTIVVSNNTATKPFGSIDTPAIGGDPGSSPNFGWGLTPKVNGTATCRIPSNGVQVSIDSGPLQPVVYGDARPDIAAAFPGFSNSAAAGGHFLFDWSSLSNGPHTIGWLITDDCGRTDGVGSRFFNVTTGSSVMAPVAGAALVAGETESDAPITVARGFGELPEIVEPGAAGSRTIEVRQGERIELRTPRGYELAYQIANGQQRGLPPGSTWDAGSGTFSWQPAPGFLGPFRVVFSNRRERISVRVVVLP